MCVIYDSSVEEKKLLTFKRLNLWGKGCYFMSLNVSYSLGKEFMLLCIVLLANVVFFFVLKLDRGIDILCIQVRLCYCLQHLYHILECGA